MVALLNVNNLTKTYKNNKGILNFSIDVNQKDIVLLLGPNGAGKTTAFKGLLGLINIDQGESNIEEKHIIGAENEAFHRIGAMISKPAFYDYLTGYENLKLLKEYYNNVDEDRINEVLELVGLVEAKDNKVRTYSTGMKQRLDFGRAIIHSPKILILDEPFSGLDIEAKSVLKEAIRMMRDQGVGVIISSHMVGDFEQLANRVVIIYEGETLYRGKMKDISNKGLTLEEHYLERIKLFKHVA